jgi:hypothetical protein
MADGTSAVRVSTIRAEDQLQNFEADIPVSDYLKIEPTDLQKFGKDDQVTLISKKRPPHKKSTKKGPKKGTKTPKK